MAHPSSDKGTQCSGTVGSGFDASVVRFAVFWLIKSSVIVVLYSGEATTFKWRHWEYVFRGKRWTIIAPTDRGSSGKAIGYGQQEVACTNPLRLR
ncbi:MAG: hypothetical protein LAP21_05395 [Acidobacteriia bacterium]|nr:hypothetical protein [Terriglobia bacterium]